MNATTTLSTWLERLRDFGGQGTLLHLAHANGFPPGTYRPLIDHLRDHHQVVALSSRPLWPRSRPENAPSWHPLADDLIRGLDTLGMRGVFGVGHSIGGVLTMWAAVRRPDLFRAVVLIDPVILPPVTLALLRLMRAVGLEGHQPLVRGALRRRHIWPNRQACFEHYRGKEFFSRWSDDSLWAYVEAGTQPTSNGKVELTYPPKWEAHIFATSPTDVWQAVPKLQVPTLVIRGRETNTFRAASQRRFARLAPEARFTVIPEAGHLVPMERPEETAVAIRRFLALLETP
jgi:pimeloyl-ACP methyl ester carboxylesterase